MYRDYRMKQHRQREWQQRLLNIREAIRECHSGNISNFFRLEDLICEGPSEEERVYGLIASTLDVSQGTAMNLYETWLEQDRHS